MFGKTRVVTPEQAKKEQKILEKMNRGPSGPRDGELTLDLALSYIRQRIRQWPGLEVAERTKLTEFLVDSNGRVARLSKLIDSEIENGTPPEGPSKGPSKGVA